jgi:hypothetical protein
MDINLDDENIDFVVYNNRPDNTYTANEMVRQCGYVLPDTKFEKIKGGLWLSPERGRQRNMYMRLCKRVDSAYRSLFNKKPTKSNFREKGESANGLPTYNYSNVYPPDMLLVIQDFMEEFPINTWGKERH